MKTAPRGVPSSTRAESVIPPRRELTVIVPPAGTPSARRSSECVDALARIGYRVLALQALPADTRDRGHRLAHFREHVARVRVVPVEPDALCHLDDDPQILTRVAGWIERLAPELHRAIGVGEGPG